MEEPSFHDVQNLDFFFFLCLAAEAGSSSSRLPVSATSVRNCFFHWPHKHVALRRSVRLRPEPLRTKVKTSLPPRKAFSAVLCSVNVKIPPSSDKTAATAASALIFSQAHNRLPAFLFLFLLLLFFWGGLCLLRLAAPTSWFGHTLKGADRLREFTNRIEN